ncbi:Uu.00g049880.m01.CDS01 [Anthostomella pinea]|uniref:Uu.00g049880.m01.CDS01 n=1 Tax=Anthostomella pinea TaxID=933095 RepID=A0AAI8VCZ7_9PEZI|nr:Uu.00g049880.m01.CDS01 [Anthostomella pinea]
MLCHAAAWSTSSIALTIALLTTISLAGGTCYNPDGSALDDTYQPCDSTAEEVSICCQTGVALQDGEDHRHMSCTDPTWESPACLSFCVDEDYAGQDREITVCDDGSYCCGSKDSGCCSERGGELRRRNGGAAPPTRQTTNPSPASPSATPTPTFTIEVSDVTPPAETTSTTTAPSFPTITHRPFIGRRGLSSQATAVIAVGASFGGIALIAVSVYFASKVKRSKDAGGQGSLPSGALPSHHAITMQESSLYASTQAKMAEDYWKSPVWGRTTAYGRSELDSTTRPLELPGHLHSAELPAYQFYR